MSRYASTFKYYRKAKQRKPQENSLAPDRANNSYDDPIIALRRLSSPQTSRFESQGSRPFLGLDRAPLARGGCELCGNFGAVPWFSNFQEIAELRRSAAAGCRTCDVLRQGYDLVREEKQGDRISVDVGRDSLFLKMEIDNNGPVMGLAFHVAKDDPALEGKPSPLEAMREFVYPVHDLTPHACARIIRSSMSLCETEHKKCQQIVDHGLGRTGFIPTRLLYVGSDVPADAPILVESSQITDINTSPRPFTALSHCWGKTQIITTTKATMASRKAGISWSALSKTFQDAIELTRALGIDYIWIDSLSIIQDDVEDWARESTQMASIYRNAYLTIGATASADGSHGLFPSERPTVHSIQLVEDGVTFPIYTWRLPEIPNINNTFAGASADCPLQLRAWTFQEQLLSARLVHFTREEVVWECFEEATCECDRVDDGRWGDHRNFKAQVMNPDSGISLSKAVTVWSKLVQGYSARQITYDHDRLPAISSLASAFDTGNDQYLAGIWRSELPSGLLWRTKKDGPGRPSRPFTIPASSPPSWSWASIDGVRVDHESYVLRSDVEIIETGVNPSTSDPRGTVTGGHITLRGYLLELKPMWERTTYKHFWLEHMVTMNSNMSDVEDDKLIHCEGYLDRTTDKAPGVNAGAFKGPVFFLLLGNVGDPVASQPGKGLFLRVLESPTLEQVEIGKRTVSRVLVERIGAAHISEAGRHKMYESAIETVTIF